MDFLYTVNRFSDYVPTREYPEFFAGRGGGADPEAIYNLFDVKNYVIKTMS
jgi:hypothetical protein